MKHTVQSMSRITWNFCHFFDARMCESIRQIVDGQKSNNNEDRFFAHIRQNDGHDIDLHTPFWHAEIFGLWLNVRPKKLNWQEWERDLESISPTFQVQLLLTYVECAAFLCLCFRFVLYWRKTVGAKAARKMLMKLSPGVNFINVLPTTFVPVGLHQSYWRTA